jgi:hypothetical protein
MNTEIITSTTTDTQIAREAAAFDMLQRQAKMFSASTLVPKDFQGNIANCAIAINIAKRLGTDPFMTIQNVDVIHGRPSFRATFLIAMVNSSGRFEPLQFKMEGAEGSPDRSCIAWAKSKDDGSVLEGPKITLAMAKAEGWSTKSGSKWITMPELMLRYRSAAFFARLYAPDITLGMMTADEAHDVAVRDVTPAPVPARNSKLFTKKEESIDVPPPTFFKEEIARQDAAELSAKPLLEQALFRIDSAGIKWSTMLETLQANGEGGQDYYPIEDASQELLQFLITNFAPLSELAKKGTK